MVRKRHERNLLYSICQRVEQENATMQPRHGHAENFTYRIPQRKEF